MKIHQEETQFFGNVSESSGFKIAASAKAFKILSSTLYKYKPRAIIRELCCNAVDGHIALARTGVQVRDTFDVTIPSQLNQQFSVRDYGIGLSEEDVTGLYSTYFASTKSNSNDEIGGFGLGSKSPFAYTDTFTVTSWFGGFKKIYSAFLKNGEPQIMKMFEVESNEPTGVEVVVPVSSELHVWEAEARRVFSSFDKYRPKFIGKPINIDYLKFDADGICWKDVSRYGSTDTYGYGVYAVMGGVVYPIPAEYWNNTMIGLYANNRAYYVRFEIGELDMTPSREELSLDPDTIESINKRVRILNKIYDVKIDKIFDVATDVRDLYSKISAELPREVWNRMVDARDFKGKTIKQWKTHFDSYSRPNQDVWNQTASVGVSIRKNKVRYASNLTNFGNDCPRIIVNDMKTGAGEVMMALHRLNKFRVEGAYVFDTGSTTLIDPKNPKAGTVGDAHKENMQDLLSYWPARMKTGKVVVLSQVRADVLKEMKDKGLVQVKKRTGKATNVVKVENGIPTNVQMYVEDIDELTDCHWVGLEWGNYRAVTPVISTETLKNGKIKEKVDSWKTDNFKISESSIKNWAAMEKKTYYVFSKPHWLRASKNKNISQLKNADFDATVLKYAGIINETHFGVVVSETWVNRMNNNTITKPLVDGLCNSNGSYSAIGTYIDSVVRNYAGMDVNGKTLDQLVREFKNEASKKAYAKIREFEAKNPMIVAYVNSTYNIRDDLAKNIVEIAKV